MSVSIADLMYNFLSPRELSIFKGCSEEYTSLAKHLSATSAVIAASISIGRGLTLIEINAIEEVVYDIIGYPQCWEEEGKTKYFLK
jgi:hypothetical protein